jgi:hypothetical protein
MYFSGHPDSRQLASMTNVGVYTLREFAIASPFCSYLRVGLISDRASVYTINPLIRNALVAARIRQDKELPPPGCLDVLEQP